MTVRRVLLFCSGLTIISVAFYLFQKFSEPTAAEIMRAEQEIYALLLAEQRYAYNDIPDKIQIVEVTNAGEFQLDIPSGGAGVLRESLELKHFSGLEEKTLLDYQQKNAESYPIKNYLSDSANIFLVNPTNSKQLYWWVSYSRIGFNPSMTQALVLVGDCRGESCYDITSVSMYSSGTYITLEWENNKWIIKERKGAWHIEAPAP
jgi:hypothetical protein